MGRLPRSYVRYDRKMIKDGWREVLTKDIAAYALTPAERK
jgi:hypothetical protein